MVVLSGKGGTGKTTVSTNLAAVAGADAALLDCDVEEPNGHLFMAPGLERSIPVHARFPQIDEEKCIHCGKCSRFCQFNALLITKKTNIVMSELCHDCGGCALVCPVDAVTYGEREVGQAGRFERSDGLLFMDGVINTGEFSAEKVIERVLEEGKDRAYRIIDSPPGCACSAVAAAEGADFALVVTEPTPFALSDMKMVVEMLEKLAVPAAVFINKAGENEEDLLAYCAEKNLPVMGKMPFSREYGKILVEGKLIARESDEGRALFEDLWSRIRQGRAG
ncbi:MAG: ATP-binding protein [Spirochaetales bacterium]|nr:ATP-binding protein [Spirochaetales bacterium]